MAHPISDDWGCESAFAAEGSALHRAMYAEPDAQEGKLSTPEPQPAEVNRLWHARYWLVPVVMLAFWLLTCVTALAQAPAAWPGVYLVYSPSTGSYSYTLNGTAPAGWRSEGIRFRVHADASAIDGQAAIALQKFLLPPLNRVALTASNEEAATLRAQGWQSDGMLGYVAGVQTAGTVPLHRLTHDGLKLNVFTTKAPGKNFLVGTFGWRYAGIVGYVKSASDNGSGTPVTPPSMPSAPVTPAAAPTLTSFSPQSAAIGATVTFTGTNFANGSTVKFNGIASSSVTWQAATSLKAVVPANATTGKVVIISAGSSITSTSDFVVSAPTTPVITSFTPTSGEAGTVVTVNGTGLSGVSAVRFGSVAVVTVANVTATSLQATVPVGASSGKISVTSGSATATSPTDFTVIVPPPMVDAGYRDAARLLTQATFGPKTSSIERVKAIGAPAWIDEQIALPAASHMAYIDAAKARRLAETGKGYYAEEGSYEAIWQQWLLGPDELRARMTFALSEIMVISNIAPDLEPDAMSSYMDMLNTRAFGTYRDLLGAVALHPAMGYYLNMLGSEKEDAKNQKFPNENFAREVMQLFSLGVYQLNADGSRKVDGSGVPLATYDEGVVKGFARAFTGWTFFGNDPANPKKFDRPEESWTQPMIAFASKHETGSKTLLNGIILPAGQTPEKDLKDALDTIANHPNVSPFISRQLIQRFVTSNPSPAYVARVSGVFDNNGRGVRGDLAAVIKAVLMDPDARGSTTLSDPKFGKQREPVIRLANLLRAFNATSKNGRNNIHYLDSADDALGQSPLLSPSVFNFFSPAYTRPGKLAQSGMVAPEFQITNEIQTVGTANFFYQLVKQEGYGSGDSQLKLDLTQPKTLANSPAALVDYLSTLLTYGELNTASRQTIIDAVAAVPFNNKDSDRTWRVRTALTLFALSSDFVIQK
ncbi:MAG: DUF1800 family protein [Betaproteobacteria bacterium]